MVTKWKNIISKGGALISKNKTLVSGAIIFAIGVYIFGYLYGVYYGMDSFQVWAIGGGATVFLASGSYLLLKSGIRIYYRDWTADKIGFYQDWKQKWKQQQWILALACIVGLIIAYTTFNFQNSYYAYNRAFSYLSFAIVIILYGVCQICTIRFMNQKIGQLMNCMTEINQKRLEEALKLEMQSVEKATQSERMKVDLISNVSHDLKTPLTSMVGYIELMKKEELNDAMKDYVDVLSNKSEKLKEMIESLFSLAKASSGNIQLNFESIQMNKLIEQIFADMDVAIEKSGLQFVPILTKADTHFTTDNTHMYRICQNLIENAIKYSARETRVYIKTYVEEIEAESRLYLEIANTAGYMMDFDKASIVERFARGDKARSSDGNGLGLAIVSTYTSALGGEFDINVEYDQFKVTLSFPKK